MHGFFEAYYGTRGGICFDYSHYTNFQKDKEKSQIITILGGCIFSIFLALAIHMWFYITARVSPPIVSAD